MSQEQNFNNHVRIDPKLLSIMLLGLASLILMILGLVWVPALYTVGTLMLPILVIATGMTARIYGFTIQDRIVRLEMELRLQRVLDAELAERATTLKLSQLIGLRFASDEELPGLVQDILDGKLAKSKEIKQQVKDWQADYQRI